MYVENTSDKAFTTTFHSSKTAFSDLIAINLKLHNHPIALCSCLVMLIPSLQRLLVSSSLLVTRQHHLIRHSAAPAILRRMSTTATSTESKNPPSFGKPVVQYIFCRRDLTDEEGNAWPLGAVAAQVAHASVAAIAEGLENQDEATQYYVSPKQLPGMTKYVYGVDSAEELENVKQGFVQKFGNYSYHCWLEQPENIPTALATLPMERTNKVSKFIQKLKVSFL